MTVKVSLLTIMILFSSKLLAFGGEISDYYLKQARENPKNTTDSNAAQEKSRSLEQVESTEHGITEIGIEREGCLGTCPIYTFIIKSDGTCHYKGEKYVERIGEFSGTISTWYFHELAKFIRDSGYMSFKAISEKGYTLYAMHLERSQTA